jgi:hypothetical protein
MITYKATLLLEMNNKSFKLLKIIFNLNLLKIWMNIKELSLYLKKIN